MESTALHLESVGDFRNLIQYVETWAEVKTPSIAARLAQVRAFLAFGMTDRAWSRLQELQNEGTHHLEVLTLTSRMFLRRGWPARARRSLDQALQLCPGDPELESLLREADGPVLPPVHPEPGAPIHELLAYAEECLAGGAFLKARRLLESLVDEHPPPSRVTDLLWVMSGTYVRPEASLLELTHRWAPDLGAFPEHTEDIELTQGRVEQAVETDDRRSFPSLFRGAESDDELSVPSEKADTTQSVRRLPTTPHMPIGDDNEETQVLRVIRPHHLDLDLRADSPEDALDLFDAMTGFESEDEDRIIFTRREDADADDENTAPISPLDLGSDLVGIPEPATPQLEGEGLDLTLDHAEPELTEELDLPSPEAPSPASTRSGTPWWLIFGLGVTAGFSLVMMTVLLWALATLW